MSLKKRFNINLVGGKNVSKVVSKAGRTKTKKESDAKSRSKGRSPR